MLLDSGHGWADGPSHADSGPFGRGSRSSITTTQPERTGQLAHDEVTLGIRLCGPFRSPHGPRLLDVRLDLDKPPAIRLFGLRIEHLAGIQSTREPQVGFRCSARRPRFDPVADDQIQNVELPSRVAEEPGQVVQALQVAQAYRMLLEHDRPVVALSPKDVLLVDVPVGARLSRLRLYLGRANVISSPDAARLRRSDGVKLGSNPLGG